MKDMVNHPEHYISDKGIEVIDVIEAFTADLKGIEATDTGNVIKYICRWKHKNGLQDLEKARWYLNHLIKRVSSKEEPSSKEESLSEEIEIYKDDFYVTTNIGTIVREDRDGFMVETENELKYFYPSFDGYTYKIIKKGE